MSKQIRQETGLIYPKNYGPFEPIAYGNKLTIETSSITMQTWDIYYKSLLNLLKDGIQSEIIHNTLVNVKFADGNEVELSIFDLYINHVVYAYRSWDSYLCISYFLR